MDNSLYINNENAYSQQDDYQFVNQDPQLTQLQQNQNQNQNQNLRFHQNFPLSQNQSHHQSNQHNHLQSQGPSLQQHSMQNNQQGHLSQGNSQQYSQMQFTMQPTSVDPIQYHHSNMNQSQQTINHMPQQQHQPSYYQTQFSYQNAALYNQSNPQPNHVNSFHNYSTGSTSFGSSTSGSTLYTSYPPSTPAQQQQHSLPSPSYNSNNSSVNSSYQHSPPQPTPPSLPVPSSGPSSVPPPRPKDNIEEFKNKAQEMKTKYLSKLDEMLTDVENKKGGSDPPSRQKQFSEIQKKLTLLKTLITADFKPNSNFPPRKEILEAAEKQISMWIKEWDRLFPSKDSEFYKKNIKNEDAIQFKNEGNNMNGINPSSVHNSNGYYENYTPDYFDESLSTLLGLDDLTGFPEQVSSNMSNSQNSNIPNSNPNPNNSNTNSNFIKNEPTTSQDNSKSNIKREQSNTNANSNYNTKNNTNESVLGKRDKFDKEQFENMPKKYSKSDP